LSIRAMIGSDGLAKGDGATSIDHGFDPMSVLIEDAVAAEPTELFYDFIDRLMTPQLPPPALEVPSSPISIPSLGARSSTSPFSKRYKPIAKAKPPAPMGSPTSTLDLSLEPPRFAQRKHASSASHQSSQNNMGLSRKNKPQRCSICKECGHKSRTCRLATGKVDPRPVSPTGLSVQLMTTV